MTIHEIPTDGSPPQNISWESAKSSPPQATPEIRPYPDKPPAAHPQTHAPSAQSTPSPPANAPNPSASPPVIPPSPSHRSEHDPPAAAPDARRDAQFPKLSDPQSAA